MFADGFTKLLGTAQHKYCKLNLGIRASLGPLSDSPDIHSDPTDEDIYVGLAALMSSLIQSDEEGDSKHRVNFVFMADNLHDHSN